MTHNLPFEVGQKAEAKSFSSGYRGAWFRCKITKIGTKEGQPTHYLEYYDFPDEQISSTRLYQKSPTDRSSKREKKELMVRPSFPPIYQKNEMPDLLSISEVIAIVDGIWRVGDLVDWWKDSCYWSGRITHILDKDRVLIALHGPPIGEGSSYEASCNDLRPSLDWTPEQGWTVPISKESDACRCARLIQPMSQGKRESDDIATSEASSKFSSPAVFSRSSVRSVLPEVSPPGRGVQAGEKNKENTETPELFVHSQGKETMMQCSGDKNKETTRTHSDSVSSRHEADSVTKRKATSRDRYNSTGPSKTMRTSETELNSTSSDTIESSILDLEELVNRVKWLKGAVKFGFRFSSETKPSWKYLDSRAPFPDK